MPTLTRRRYPWTPLRALFTALFGLMLVVIAVRIYLGNSGDEAAPGWLPWLQGLLFYSSYALMIGWIWTETRSKKSMLLFGLLGILHLVVSLLGVS
jgi:hypothetical protein